MEIKFTEEEYIEVLSLIKVKRDSIKYNIESLKEFFTNQNLDLLEKEYKFLQQIVNTMEESGSIENEKE